MKSILHGVTAADVVGDPFPHVVVDGAVEDDLYAELAAGFPPGDVIVGNEPLENNTAYRMPAARILTDRRVAGCWRDFARHHTSATFFREVLAIFGPSIRSLHPALVTDGLRTSIRGYEPIADVALDCQLAWGSPVTGRSTSNGPHVDREVALFAGLLYMRLDGDDTEGGDLELYRFKGAERRYDAGRFVEPSLLEPVRRIPYAANRLVFFIHAPHAVHGVTLRAVTPWPRLHVNFLAEFPRKVFELEIAS
jgi:hypothetical protein